jgi:hypothetical protein
MFETITRSIEITKIAFKVIKDDKELLFFPVLAGIFSFLFFIAMAFPFVLAPLFFGMFGGQLVSDFVLYVLIFLLYLGLSVISTFFTMCAVHTIKTRFEGGNASFLDSIKFAFSKFHLIVAWGFVNATIGLILRIIDNIAERIGGIGEIVIKILTGLLGAAWSILTLFVVPAMVYENIGPIDAIKKSVGTLKKTWGESLVREIGTGILTFFFMLLGIIIFGILFFVTLPLNVYLALGIFALGVLYLISVFVLFSLIDTIYNTALYAYAKHGKVPYYKSEVLEGAFSQRQE